MRANIRHNWEYRDTVSLAGWLFADLLLGLSMLFFVFNTVGPPPPPPERTPTPTSIATATAMATPTSTSTTTATAKATSTPTPLPPTPTITPPPEPTMPPGLNPISVTFTLRTDVLLLTGQAKEKERARIRDEIRGRFESYRGTDGRPTTRAGIVLAFGNDQNPTVGGRLSREVLIQMVAEMPDVFGEPTVLKDYHTILAAGNITQKNTVDLEIYFLQGGSP